MPVPVWVPGQQLNANEITAWMTANGGYKTANTGRSSLTSLVADPDLELTFPGGGTWIIESVVKYHGPVGVLLAWGWLTSASAIAGSVAALFTNGSGNVEISYRQWTFAGSQAFTNSVTSEFTVRFSGLVTVPSGTSSSLAFAWAQGSTNATPVTVESGSYMLGWRAN